MRYWGPINSPGGIYGNDGYVDGNPAVGLQGSIPTFRTFEQTLRELQNYVIACGLTPSDVMNGIQVAQAVQTSKVKYSQDTGAANAISIALNPVPVGYVTGMIVRVRMAASNTSPSTTINVNGMGPKAVVRPSLGLLEPGDLPIDAVVELAYDGTVFQLVSWNGSAVTKATKVVYDVPGTYTYTATANGPHRWSIWSGGGGGGHGGGSAVSSGGSAGSFMEKTIVVTKGQTFTVLVAAAGAAATGPGGPGGTGGISRITWTGVPPGSPLTVNGGPGGLSGSDVGSGRNSPAPSALPIGGDRNLQGQQGQPGFNPTYPGSHSGTGGNAPLGGLGGVGGGGVASPGTPPGGGGGGSASSLAAGVGARGEVWVEF